MILPLDVALDRLNVPVARFKMVDSMVSAERVLKGFGFPVVLKLVSDKAVHKTEVGGVKVVHSLVEFREVVGSFLEKGRVLVQEFCGGVEFFVGLKNDASFGHVIGIGVGGIFVEVFKDVSFRVCPVSSKDVVAMIDELKGKALLEGVRGGKPVDMKALVDAVVKLSHLPEQIKNLEEFDVNPLMVDDKGVRAVDARIVLKD